MEAFEVLGFLLLGTLLGSVGQGARALIGIKKNKSKTKGWFDLKRLIISLIIGGVAGTLAAIAFLNQPINKTLLFSLVASGYAGTDFIEGFMRKHIKK